MLVFLWFRIIRNSMGFVHEMGWLMWESFNSLDVSNDAVLI